MLFMYMNMFLYTYENVYVTKQRTINIYGLCH